MKTVTYRAKRACRIGGAYREEGEFFRMGELDILPRYLELVVDRIILSRAGWDGGLPDDKADAAPTGSVPTGRRPRPASKQGPMPEDLTGAQAKPSSDFTSADMIKA